ncbi:isochorismatase family protein [Mycobacterium sp. URHD0025]|uniref:isochorismatase family protein n=1 Tax=Mycobacterium sp. URHD0025 TaxID=1298864 RepID=UPI0003FA593F|nr:isochorismatase family protein [Mycobacterium sp. URHD0025]
MTIKVGPPDLSPSSAAQSDLTSAYAAAGFGFSFERGTHPAVVVVDLTNGFTDPAVPTGADLSDEIAATIRVVAAARRVGAPVIFTTISYNRPEQAATWLAKTPGLRALREGTPLVDIDARLDVRPADRILVKHHASAFFGTDLAEQLRAQGVDSIVVCGATTSGCVRATAVDGVSHGFPILVPREAVGDRAQAPHDAALFDLQAKYADVLPTSEVVAYLDSLKQDNPSTKEAANA